MLTGKLGRMSASNASALLNRPRLPSAGQHVLDRLAEAVGTGLPERVPAPTLEHHPADSPARTPDELRIVRKRQRRNPNKATGRVVPGLLPEKEFA